REGDILKPAFKNATFWSNKEHWDWAVYPNERERASFLKENILPIEESGQLKFVDCGSLAEGRAAEKNTQPVMANNEQLPTVNFDLPDIKIKIVSGHTESMMLPQIKYKDRTVVFMADLLPSQGHIPIPYVMGYDMFPLTTINEKRSFLKEGLEGDYILFFEHDPVYECCNLQQTPRGIRPKDFFKIADL
ncbi:MAG: MBL fold metallo-hydrolase, partial [Chitinophagaceae bacterium]